MNSIIYCAIIGSITTLSAAILTFLLTNKSNKKRKYIEYRITYIEKQIEHLYGPLYNLIVQLYSLNSVKEKIIKTCNNREISKIDNFFRKKYFQPIHIEIRKILMNNLFLIKEETIPKSFEKYLQHATQDESQSRLYEDESIETQQLKGEPWPTDFAENINKNINSLKNELFTLRESLNY